MEFICRFLFFIVFNVIMVTVGSKIKYRKETAMMTVYLLGTGMIFFNV